MMYANPVKRLRKQHNITQEALANAGEIQRLSVLRTEQGLYETIPSAVLAGLDALVKDVDFKRLHADYAAFQCHTRVLHGPLSKDRLDFKVARKRLTDYPDLYHGHKLICLRDIAGWSQIGLCIRMCVNAGLIHKWESGKQLQAPRQLLDALRDAGYSEDDINWLEH